MDHKERRYRESRSHYESERRDHHNKHKHKHKHKEKKDKKDKKEKKEKKYSSSIEIVEPEEEFDDGKSHFMFVYEDKDGKIYPKLTDIKTNDGELAKILPVYFQYGNENLTEEAIKWSNERSQWQTMLEGEDKENTWLNIIESPDPDNEIHIFEDKNVVVYNNRFFYSDAALFLWLEENGAEVLPVEQAEN